MARLVQSCLFLSLRYLTLCVDCQDHGRSQELCRCADRDRGAADVRVADLLRGRPGVDVRRGVLRLRAQVLLPARAGVALAQLA